MPSTKVCVWVLHTETCVLLNMQPCILAYLTGLCQALLYLTETCTPSMSCHINRPTRLSLIENQSSKPPIQLWWLLELHGFDPPTKAVNHVSGINKILQEIQHGGAVWPAPLSAVIINSVSQALSPSTPRDSLGQQVPSARPELTRDAKHVGGRTQQASQQLRFHEPQVPGDKRHWNNCKSTEQTFMSEGSIVVRR